MTAGFQIRTAPSAAMAHGPVAEAGVSQIRFYVYLIERACAPGGSHSNPLAGKCLVEHVILPPFRGFPAAFSSRGWYLLPTIRSDPLLIKVATATRTSTSCFHA